MKGLKTIEIALKPGSKTMSDHRKSPEILFSPSKT
jgi:hypothetical protein